MEEEDIKYVLFSPERIDFEGFFYMDDNFYMKKVLSLASMGRGYVSPNPMVGALIVLDGKIIGRGFHKVFGGPHAEIEARYRLKGECLDRATLYVNLEPCCHFGKTPPCVDFIIQSGIKRVVIGTLDPNPLVNGKGVRKLKSAGVATEVGIMKEECLRLNEVYFKFITKKKPFVVLKIAQTIDGRIATKEFHSKWITGEESLKMVHKIRKEYDSILVGINTVIKDDPELTVRKIKSRKKKRFILDTKCRIPLTARLLHLNDSENTVIITTEHAPENKIKKIKDLGAEIWTMPESREGDLDIEKVLLRMAKRGVASVVVEGGKKVFTSFLKRGEFDRVVTFIAPKIFGSGVESVGDLGIVDIDDAITFRDFKWYKSGSEIVFDGRR